MADKRPHVTDEADYLYDIYQLLDEMVKIMRDIATDLNELKEVISE